MDRRTFLRNSALAVAGSGIAAEPWRIAAAQATPIKIGLMAPLTGVVAAGGKEVVEGFQMFWDSVGGEIAGRKIDTRAIRRTALLTVEGERDDICAVGQTVAAHDLCGKLRPYLKRQHMQAGVGHYGVFSGKRWENQIYPIVKNVILSSD